jgi:hypothetical protein
VNAPLWFGSLLDLIIAATIVEAGALSIYASRTGRAVAPHQLLPTLAAGVAILIAVRLAIGGAWWGWIALCLIASLVAHLVDLTRRWRR